MKKNWTEQDVERLLRQAVGQSVPNVYQEVAAAPVDPLLNPDHIVPPAYGRRRRWSRAIGALCAALCLVLGLGLFLQFHTAAIVAIGSEPDVELSVNRFGRVLEARGRSETGEALLAGLSLKGEALDDAVERLGRSMAAGGYLDGSDIPVSVDGGDWKYNRDLEEEARDALEDVLEDWGGGGHAVIAPAVEPTASPVAIPTLTPTPTALPTAATVPSAAPTTQQPAAPPSTAPSTGGNSLWSSEQAMAAALAHAGLSAGNATFTKVELDRDDGRTIYKLEFYGGGWEYEYKVDAYTGAIREGERKGGHESGGASAAITAAQAESIALEHAGLTAGQVTEREVELEDDDGVLYYQVEFQRGEVDYEYEIDATTGAIRKAERD